MTRRLRIEKGRGTSMDKDLSKIREEYDRKLQKAIDARDIEILHERTGKVLMALKMLGMVPEYDVSRHRHPPTSNEWYLFISTSSLFLNVSRLKPVDMMAFCILVYEIFHNSELYPIYIHNKNNVEARERRNSSPISDGVESWLSSEITSDVVEQGVDYAMGRDVNVFRIDLSRVKIGRKNAVEYFHQYPHRMKTFQILSDVFSKVCFVIYITL